MTPRTKTAVVVGSITRDRILTPRRLVEKVGGAVWYAGSTFARLGMRTRVVCRFAAADRAIGDAISTAGMEVLRRSSMRTTTFVNDYTDFADEDRRQDVLAVADPIGVDEVRSGLRGCNLAYLGPLHPDDIAEEALSVLALTKRFTIALDVQGYTRTIVRGRVDAKVDDRLFTLLPACDAIKASRREAFLLTSFSDPSEAAMDLQRTRPGLETVVTCGAEGACIAVGGVVHFQVAEGVDTDDPTGAGDMFFASYLARRIHGSSLESAAEYAARFTAQRLRDPMSSVLLTPA